MPAKAASPSRRSPGRPRKSPVAAAPPAAAPEPVPVVETFTREQVEAMIAEAMLKAKAEIEAQALVPVVAPEPEPEPEASVYPKVFYNPVIPDERFLVPGSPYAKFFSRGKFVALTKQDEVAVRAALAAHGADAADRWQGDDMPREMRFTSPAFATRNANAFEDYARIHQRGL